MIRRGLFTPDTMYSVTDKTHSVTSSALLYNTANCYPPQFSFAKNSQLEYQITFTGMRVSIVHCSRRSSTLQFRIKSKSEKKKLRSVDIIIINSFKRHSKTVYVPDSFQLNSIVIFRLKQILFRRKHTIYIIYRFSLYNRFFSGEAFSLLIINNNNIIRRTATRVKRSIHCLEISRVNYQY